jgi:threonine synthase
MVPSSPSLPARNPRLIGFVCLRCETPLPIADYDGGCPRCARDGYPANLRAVYASGSGAIGIALPYPSAVSLGEGATPLVEVPQLAAAVRVGRLSLKLEWCNPTGSHKDRMSAQLLARVSDRGADRVVAASSGNAGVSIAAYAARYGLAAEIVATAGLPGLYRRAIAAHGAALTTVTDSHDRWTHLARRVAEGAFAATNYHLPAIGTNPFGIEGYKMITAEIATAGLPDLVVAPSARGDLLSGLCLGFAEAGQGIPALIASEPYPRLARVMAGEDYRGSFEGKTAQFSIAGTTVTYQSLHALRRSGGRAVAVDDEAARRAGAMLAQAGFHAELSAASTLAALAAMAVDGTLAGRHAVLILTGSGFRNAADRPGDDADLRCEDAAQYWLSPDQRQHQAIGLHRRDIG